MGLSLLILSLTMSLVTNTVEEVVELANQAQNKGCKGTADLLYAIVGVLSAIVKGEEEKNEQRSKDT